MKSETIIKRDIRFIFIYPFFEAETKKEEKWAFRMNGFFSRMGAVIEKYAGSKDFPDGGKFTVECTFTPESAVTQCKLTLKQRGRTLHRKCIVYQWHKGYINKSNIM